jgi:hypothetical protein
LDAVLTACQQSSDPPRDIVVFSSWDETKQRLTFPTMPDHLAFATTSCILGTFWFTKRALQWMLDRRNSTYPWSSYQSH